MPSEVFTITSDLELLIHDEQTLAAWDRATLVRLLAAFKLGLAVASARLAALPETPAALPVPEANGQAPEADRLITVAEAAKRLSCCPKTLYRRRKSLPFFVSLPGRAVRISERRLARYLERRTV